MPLPATLSLSSSTKSSHKRPGKVYAKLNVNDTGNEFELPNTAIAVTKSVSGSFNDKNHDVPLEQPYEINVDNAKKIGMMAKSISLDRLNELANLENIRHGVNKSTFNELSSFCPCVFNNPVFAAKNPAKQIITTSKTASKVKYEISK